MKKFTAIVAVLIGIALQFGYIKASVFPEGIEVCRYENEKCMKEQAQAIVDKYAKTGFTNLVQLSPLHLNRLKLNKNPNSPVSINLDFKDVDLHGLERATVNSVTGFDAAGKKPLDIKAFIPKLILKGLYRIDGKVIILPITGKGSSEITLDKLNVNLKVKSQLYQKANETYIDIQGVEVLLLPKHVHYYFEGLFKNDKALSENMLMFLNDNWDEIFSELKPDIQDALGLAFKQIFRSFFSRHPYRAFVKP